MLILIDLFRAGLLAPGCGAECKLLFHCNLQGFFMFSAAHKQTTILSLLARLVNLLILESIEPSESQLFARF